MPAVTDVFSELGLTRPPSAERKRTELGQEDFLTLMITQLRNQDPTKPLESAQFLGQIAQFSTVSGIQGLQESFTNLAGSLQSDQALQGAALIGRNVRVDSSTAALPAEGDLSGAADLPASASVTVEVRDAAGAVVRTFDLGPQPAGLVEFNWDGVGADGTRQPPGTYTIAAFATAGGQTASLSTFATGRVDSVTLSQNGLVLNLAGIGSVALSDIRQFL